MAGTPIPMSSHDPVIAEIRRMLKLPSNCTGFTLTAKVDELVKIEVHYYPPKSEPTEICRTSLDSSAQEYVLSTDI